MMEVMALVVFLYLSSGVVFGLMCMTVYVLLGGEWKELFEYPAFLTFIVASAWLAAWPVVLAFIMIRAVQAALDLITQKTAS